MQQSVLKKRPGRNAHMVGMNIGLWDYLDVGNAVFRGGPAPLPAVGSVDIHWMGTGEKTTIDNPAAGFHGNYRQCTADLVWSIANAAGYALSTANSSEVNITHAYTVNMRSGVFYNDDD